MHCGSPLTVTWSVSRIRVAGAPGQGEVVVDAPPAEPSRGVPAESAVPAAVSETNEDETSAALEASPAEANAGVTEDVVGATTYTGSGEPPSAASSCYTGSKLSETVNLKVITFASETGSFDLTDCDLKSISCLGPVCATTYAGSCTVGLPQSDVVGFKDVITESGLVMMSALGQQPVSMVIEADQSFFQVQKTGAITATCETELDHGVLAVCHGTECGTDEWNAIFLFSVTGQMWPLVRYSIESCRVLVSIACTSIFPSQHHLCRLHTLLRITCTVFVQKTW